MNPSRFKYEQLLYATAFLLALVVRLVGAEATPLTDREAGLALQALALSHGQSTLIGPYPAYLTLTTALMFIFQAGSWVVRFWPALAGSLLVLLPALFRPQLRRLPALLLALFLALDPGLLGVSRTAGGSALALCFLMLALGLWLNQKPALAGLAGGLALLSGPQVWPGLIGLAAAIWISGWLNRKQEPVVQTHPNEGQPVQGEDIQPEENPAPTGWRRALIAALAVIFFVGTLFFTIPDGLSAMADSLPAYLRGWTSPAGVPAGLLLVALLVYELFPLVFGVWGGLGSLFGSSSKTPAGRKRNAIDRMLLIWWITALVLALLYPGRQVGDLAWSLLPLWALAARQVARLVTVPAGDRLTMLGHMILSAIMLAYVSMGMASWANGAVANPVEWRVRMAAALVMVVASTALIAWGWSRMVALRGLSWGIGLLLLVYMISAGWNSIGLSGRTGEELWRGEPGVYGTDLLNTLHDFKQWGGQEAGGPDLVVVGAPSPAIEWLLRGFERVSYVSQVPVDSSPALVITPLQPDLSLAATYRGQDFAVSENVSWDQLKPGDWFRWLVFRTAPSGAFQQNHIVLWARVDLFPGGEQAGQTGKNTSNHSPAP